MKSQTAKFDEDDEPVDDVPGSSWLRQKGNRYGTVPGLPANEFANYDELGRQVLMEQSGPVLMLPMRAQQNEYRPGSNESGGIDFEACAADEFERTVAEFDKSKKGPAPLPW